MSEIKWESKSLDYKSKKYFKSEEINDHPLKPATITVIDSRTSIRRNNLRSFTSVNSAVTRTPTPTQATLPSSVNDDPLSNHSSLDGSDPLTQFAKEELDPLTKMAKDEWDHSVVIRNNRETLEELIESWAGKRIAILSKYTTLEKLSIVTSFLPGGEKVIMKVHTSGSMVDKVKTRLEQLDDFEDGSVRQMLNLSQAEYVTRIEQLNHELVSAWNSDQRVKALKIAIQCTKLLVDTSVIAFYPSKFVLITDILDIFGKLVFERLRVKAEYIKPGSKTPTCLPENFTPDMVPEVAKETCQNWFYKIASIRELVPRLYVEMAILKSYNFLNISMINAALTRITKMIRGIGDPLVAIYARCYLCRVGFLLRKNITFDFAKENFYDFLLVYPQLFSNFITNELIKQNIAIHSYLNLYIPALDWILQLLITTAFENQLIEIYNLCQKQPNNGLLLNAILTTFKPVYISSRATELLNWITSCKDDGFPQYILYRSLGEAFNQAGPPKEDCQKILDIIWKYLSNLGDTTKFMYLIEVWIEFVITQFSSIEVNMFLGAIINHLGPSRTFQYFYSQLQIIIEKLVMHTQDFETLLTMDNFLPVIDLFQKESIKVDVCKSIVESLSKQNGPITDPVMINGLMYIMKMMHDSVSALSVEDEKRQISHLICGVILRVDFARDFEKQLNFFVEARASFYNLDIVHMQLVQCVNRLAIETRKIVRGHHTRRTSAFVRACAAFCFITIPSLGSAYSKLQLYLLSGQVALLNQCYGQADACFKAALSLVPEMPKTMDIDGRTKSAEPFMLCYLSNVLSTLLVVPDSPEHGVLYLMRGLLNAVQRYFEEYSMFKSQLYLKVLDLLSVMTQESYPYHIDKVDSNDKLYGSDPKFIAEVDKIATKIFEELLNFLKHYNASEQYDKQATLAIELFTRLIMRANLENSTMLQMAVKLWNLCEDSDGVDPKFRSRTIKYLVQNKHSSQMQNFNDIIEKMSK